MLQFQYMSYLKQLRIFGLMICKQLKILNTNFMTRGNLTSFSSKILYLNFSSSFVFVCFQQTNKTKTCKFVNEHVVIINIINFCICKKSLKCKKIKTKIMKNKYSQNIWQNFWILLIKHSIFCCLIRENFT